ncbi:GrpB family protein [Streptomyces sp. NBC_00378]|uniref:GrpB family protein n=1 Tax=unclassified Streptomyces TaxID=2593676 RepID=UPI0022538E6B|nr:MULTISPECIES: GrpB family protein [unclassified Streptomyces]MCX5112509.1 GrpB family protein [Streptomyces sp. NBC_00378]
MTRLIVVSGYDPQWPERFEDLRQRLAPHVADLAVSIEHVGSTAVPGCAAKPIIDLEIVVAEEVVMPELIYRLVGQGYRHEGNLGIRGREAFQAPSAASKHHLYGVVAGSKPHLDHVLLRDYLRQRPDEVQRYSALKMALAQRLPADSEGRLAYSAAKSAVVEELVAKGYAARAASGS